MTVFSKGAALITAGKARLVAGLAGLELNPVPVAPLAWRLRYRRC